MPPAPHWRVQRVGDLSQLPTDACPGEGGGRGDVRLLRSPESVQPETSMALSLLLVFV